MKTLVSLGLAIVISLSLGCNRETGHAAGESNSDMQQRIQSRLNTDAELTAAKLNVEADAANNQVTITGTVDSEELRSRAVELAKSADSGVIVDSKIDVVHHELTREEYTEELARQEREKAKTNMDTVGKTLDDAWIHAKVDAKLIADTFVAERKIHVDVDDNVVTLRGNVSSAEEKSKAEQRAMETNGVKRVINQINIQP